MKEHLLRTELADPIFKEDDFAKILLMIRGAVATESFDMAVDYILILNEMLMERGKSPLTIRNILFLNWDLFVDKDKNDENLSRVYIVEFSDSIVKIGISKNPDARLRALENQRGFQVTKKTISKSSKNASKIEHYLHEQFHDYRLEGEYFTCSYEEVVKNAVEHFRDFTNLNTPLVGVM